MNSSSRSSLIPVPPGLIQSLRRSKAIAALTGAGVSAESGIPTFREAQTGLWARYDPLELATPQAFQRDPALVWNWYAWRRENIRAAQPNPGHIALARMETHSSSFTLITQNVDGLHRQAGSHNLVELHGNIHRNRCFEEGRLVEEPENSGNPPRCPNCGGFLRPDVVWFREPLPAREMALAIRAAETCDVFMSIGTSSLVEPAASLGRLAKHRGATLIEVNPESTPLTPFVDFVFREPAGTFLPRLIETTWLN